MGHPGNPKAPEVAQAIDSSFRKMLAAGRTPGTPATAENLKTLSFPEYLVARKTSPAADADG